MNQPAPPPPTNPRAALFALRPLVGAPAVAAAFAWAGQDPDRLALAHSRLVAGARLDAAGHWSDPAPVPGAPAPPSTPPGPLPEPDGGVVGPLAAVGASLVSGRLAGRPTAAEPATVPPRPSKRHPPPAPSSRTAAPPDDPYVHLTTSLPRSLRRAITARAAALGLAEAAYLRELVRAELGAAGWEVPVEPRAAARGRHAGRGRGRGD